MSKTELIADIHARWGAIQKKARTKKCKPPAGLTLLGTSLKVSKSDAVFPDTRSRILYLAPAWEAFEKGEADGRTLCPWATTCPLICLGRNSGQLALSHSERARLWKATLFLGDRGAFNSLLGRELAAFSVACTRQGIQGAVRLDGSSDLGLADRFAPQFPELAFYDYTKSLARVGRQLKGGHRLPGRREWPALHPDNWSLCYSFDGTPDGRRKAKRVLAAGGTVAVVFNSLPARGDRAGAPIPATWEGYPVDDGDTHDFLPADLPGHVRGLRFKAFRDRAGSLETAGSFVEPVGVTV